MHVPNQVSGRKYPFLDAVLTLARRWRNGPAIFIGDTNSGRMGLDEESPAFTQREEDWIDGMEGAGWLRRVRYVWGTVAGSERRDALSDHAALIVDLGD